MIKIIIIFAMLITTHENIKKQSCHLHCQSAYSTQSGKPLYLTGVFKMNNTETEFWKDIDGFNDYYQVSNFTNVKSLTRTIVNTNGVTMVYKEKLLKPMPNNRGYVMVHLSKNSKLKPFTIHKLVAIAFVPNPQNKPHINHINSNKLDNRPENLEWVTLRENTSHYYLTTKRSSQYTGVRKNPNKKNSWSAVIRYNKEKCYLGTFNTEIEAHNAYQKALKEINEGIFVVPPKCKRFIKEKV